MIDVLENNFMGLYPELEESLKNASFIAIDAEFTGIKAEEHLKYSLFDTLDDRYQKLRRNIKSFVIVQFGITVFQHDLRNNGYNAECFNFYLLPRSMPFKNRQFTWQVAALEFLSTHNFDFNKFAYFGISYLDQIEEQLLKQELQNDNFMENLDHLSYQEGNDFKECKSKVSEWLETDQNKISLELLTASPILQYMVHKELRNNFENIWTISGPQMVIVMRVSKDVRQALETESGNTLKETLLDTYIGFSKIFKLLTSLKKPIIGHNVLLDLMFMHQQFYRPLPSDYNTFKSNINTLFPQIYDTKFLSFELRKVLNREANWRVNSLSTIYEYFQNDKAKHLVFNSPSITLKDTSLEKKSYHNAGWDAYFAGYIFVKIAYIFTVKKYGEGLQYKSVTHSELMSSVKCFVNCINVARGNEIYTNLDGSDPIFTRPEWLHVKMKSPCLNIKQVAETFSSFGQVDVMPFARKRVLVAVANHKSAVAILHHFQNNDELQVVRYSPIRHATPSKFILWSGIALSSGIVAWMLHRIFKKSVQID